MAAAPAALMSVEPRPGLTRQQQIGLAVLGLVLAFALLKSRRFTLESALILVVLVPSIVLHEVSHGLAAFAFGDPTAKEAGRLTLNPLRHVDPFGTIILPLILVIGHAAAFGYAKPVPVSPRRMRSPRNHNLLVALAGPATNIALAVLSVVVLRLAYGSDRQLLQLGFLRSAPMLAQVLFWLGFVNVVLAAFNLIPIPPLDGSAVVERVLPRQLWMPYLRFRRYSMLLILGLVFLVPGALDRVFFPALRAWHRLL